MKTLLALIFLVVACNNAFSQNGGVELYVGGSSSMLRGDIDEDVNLSRRPSVQGGFLFLVPISDSFFCIKTGLGYSGLGAIAGGENIKLNYAELPLLFSYSSKKVDFFIGPQASFLIGSNSSLDKTRDFGVKYGIGAELSKNLFARAFFYHGLSNLVDSPDIDLTNRYISLVIGYRFAKEVE